jgi:hypothetical protein
MSAPSESSYRLAEPGRAVATLAVALVAFTAAWALLHVGFWADYRIVDTPVYEEYGEAMADGAVPYREFDVEYPPGALPAFLVPELVAPDDFAGAFEGLVWFWGALTVGFVVATLARIGVRPPRLVFVPLLVALAPLLLGSLVLTRYDLWPAALVAAALAALAAGRERLGAGVLAVAVAAKIYPLVLLPVALVWVAQRSGRRAALAVLGVFAAVLAAIVLPFAVVAPGGLADSLTVQLGRPLQIESLAGGVLLAAKQVGVYEPTVVSSHGSQNLAGGLPDALATAQTVAGVVALLAVWVAFARRPRGREGLLLGSAAALAAFVAFGKVLSPQFLVWLVPVVPLVAGAAGLAAAAVLGAALVATQGWFPHRYWDVVDLQAIGWLVLVRDLLLVALFAVLLTALARGGRVQLDVD